MEATLRTRNYLTGKFPLVKGVVKENAYKSLKNDKIRRFVEKSGNGKPIIGTQRLQECLKYVPIDSKHHIWNILEAVGSQYLVFHGQSFRQNFRFGRF